MVLSVLFVGIFFDLDPVKSFPLRKAARAVTQQLGKLVEMNVQSVQMTSWVAGIVDELREADNALKDYGIHMMRKLLDSGLSVSQATWSQIVPTAGAMVANQAQVVRCSLKLMRHVWLMMPVYSIAGLLPDGRG